MSYTSSLLSSGRSLALYSLLAHTSIWQQTFPSHLIFCSAFFLLLPGIGRNSHGLIRELRVHYDRFLGAAISRIFRLFLLIAVSANSILLQTSMSSFICRQ